MMNSQHNSPVNPILANNHLPIASVSNVGSGKVNDLTFKLSEKITQPLPLSISGDHTTNETNKSSKKAGVAKGKVARARKPRDMPRRPLSAYNVFFKSERARLLHHRLANETHRSSVGGKIGFAPLAKAIAEKWKIITQAELDKCKATAAEDMRRYKVEMQEYNDNLAAKSSVHHNQEHADTSQSHSLPVTSIVDRNPHLPRADLSGYYQDYHNSQMLQDSLLQRASAIPPEVELLAIEEQRRSAERLVQEIKNCQNQDASLRQARYAGLHASMFSDVRPRHDEQYSIYEQLLASEVARNRQEVTIPGGMSSTAALLYGFDATSLHTSFDPSRRASQLSNSLELEVIRQRLFGSSASVLPRLEEFVHGVVPSFSSSNTTLSGSMTTPEALVLLESLWANGENSTSNDTKLRGLHANSKKQG